MKLLSEIITSNLCLGCGLCNYDKNINGFSFNNKKGINIPVLQNNKDYSIAFDLCPAKGYKIIEDAKMIFGSSEYNLELGYIKDKYVARTYSERILENASSGGIITQILFYLLEKKIVDKVAVTKFIYTPEGPRTKTFLTSSFTDIIESQGSKYCPVDMSTFIDDFKDCDSKIAFVGTPCQVAGIRKIQEFDNQFKNNIVITISNFCGGYKNYNNVRKLALRHHIDYKNTSFFRFRGGGQPGSLLMKDIHDNKIEIPYPRYTGYTGYSKMQRCHLCVDATGELSDISCGDAWLEKYLKDKNTWSIIITRSVTASDIIQDMYKEKYIDLRSVENEEIIQSQRQNINSKKIRGYSRFALYKFLGYKIPVFDGGYKTEYKSISTEIKVFLKHKIKYFIEIFGLYKYFREITGKKY